jgi:hypothetical protein
MSAAAAPTAPSVRPALPSFSSGEETEDDGDPQAQGAGAGGAGPEPLKEGPAAEELLVEKKRAVKRKFTEDMLIGPCGLNRLYGTFPKKCHMRGRGYEVQYKYTSSNLLQGVLMCVAVLCCAVLCFVV